MPLFGYVRRLILVPLGKTGRGPGHSCVAVIPLCFLTVLIEVVTALWLVITLTLKRIILIIVRFRAVVQLPWF